MHSRIIALNTRTNEDEVFEYMNGIADYVDDRGQDDDWGLEILERIGTVDREQHTFRPDRDKVIERLEAAYSYYQEQEIRGIYRPDESLPRSFRPGGQVRHLHLR